jgi:hypothetical protein
MRVNQYREEYASLDEARSDSMPAASMALSICGIQSPRPGRASDGVCILRNQAATPNNLPTPAVIPIASALQKVTRQMPLGMLAPPV